MKTVKLSRTLTAVLALLLALCLSLPLTACGGGSPLRNRNGSRARHGYRDRTNS